MDYCFYEKCHGLGRDFRDKGLTYYIVKWAVDRAKHYSEKLGIPWEEILNSWESERNYWYMNYYQECRQPRIEGERVQSFMTAAFSFSYPSITDPPC